MFLTFLPGSWGKWLWQPPEMRYEPWQVCLLYVPEGNSSPVRAKMNMGQCVSHVCCLSVPCSDIEMNSLPLLQSHKAASRRESRRTWQLQCDSDEGFYHHFPPPAHLLSVCPSAVWCESIVTIIAFKTGLDSRPRIFQLWSVKPIT